MKILVPFFVIIVLSFAGCKKFDPTLSYDNSEPHFFYSGVNTDFTSPKAAASGYYEKKGNLIVIKAVYTSLLTEFTLEYDPDKITNQNTSEEGLIVEANTITYLTPFGTTLTNTYPVKLFVHNQKRKKLGITGSSEAINFYSPEIGNVQVMLEWGSLMRKK